MLDRVVGFELGTAAAGSSAGAVDADGRPLYRRAGRPRLDGGPVRTAAGYAVLPEHDAAMLATADTVIVPGIVRPAAMTRRHAPRRARRRAAPRPPPDARMVSICTGAFVLAAAGLLDGRPATTHWGTADRSARLFPAVRLDADVLFVDDGDVLTSAGCAAGHRPAACT